MRRHGRPTIDRGWRRLLDRSFPRVPRPHDEPLIEVAGGNPHPVLLLGSGAAAGWGVASHRQALTGQLAEALADITHTGASVEAVVSPSMTVSSAAEFLADVALERCSAVVVTLGLTDALRLMSARTFRKRARELLTLLEARTTRIVLVGVQPVRSIPQFDTLYGAVVQLCATRINAVLRGLGDEFPTASFTPLPAPPPSPAGKHRTAAAYRYWADAIAAHLAMRALVPGSDQTTTPHQTPGDQEAARLSALDSLGVLDTEPEARFDRIVALARTVFDTRYAALTLVDESRQWTKSTAGMSPTAIPRDQSFCQFTIADITPTVIPDSRREARTKNLTTTRDGFVFYAGHPLRAPTGHLVGALCVFDTQPRERNTVDTQLLHDLAMLAQRELWKTPEPAAVRVESADGR